MVKTAARNVIHQDRVVLRRCTVQHRDARGGMIRQPSQASPMACDLLSGAIRRIFAEDLQDISGAARGRNKPQKAIATAALRMVFRLRGPSNAV